MKKVTGLVLCCLLTATAVFALDDARFYGTWVADDRGDIYTFTFNEDGTAVYSQDDDYESSTYKGYYAIIDEDGIALSYPYEDIYHYWFTGKVLLISDGYDFFFCTKKEN
ncbi:MAG: hypothetical protein MJ178_09665 [Treponemataceae bacterium]|nr:hypothetical protein [Treponemataceae bacterium]